MIRDLAPGGRAEVLGELVDRIRLPEPVDRRQLLARLLEREAVCTTALADGVAMPHPIRSGPRLLRRHDIVALARTREPVPFGALDGGRTDLFLLILARGPRRQTVLLARAARLVREKSLLRLLRSNVDAASMIRRLRDVEHALFKESVVTG